VAWNARRPQLADARVRRAITHATDREGFVENYMHGYASVANSSVPEVHWAYRADRPVALPYDPERARSLLEEAGWTDRDGDGVRENGDGLPLSLTIKYNTGNETRQTIAELMQTQLREVGIAARAEGLEYTTMLGQFYVDPSNRDYEGAILGWTVEFRLDDSDKFPSERRNTPAGFSGTDNPRLDGLLEALDTTLDRATARRLWGEYQDVLIEEQPYTFFYVNHRMNGVNPRLNGVEMDARGELLSLRRWWIDPAERR
jgi:peptide/nickel transport system substrate-binding protein